MCGIAGASLSPLERVSSAALAKALLLAIEERGRHATGAAWTEAGTGIWIRKQAVPASEYVKHDHVPADATTFITHTRWATKGSPDNNDNNHPIDVNGVVGVHNGCLYNDDELFDVLGKDTRIAQVDSEAAFAWIAHSGLTAPSALTELRGSAALAWLAGDQEDTLHLARVSYSPLVTATTAAGSLLFASTERAIRAAAAATGLTVEKVTVLDEGTYLQVRDGRIIHADTFSTDDRPAVLSSTERRAVGLR